MQTVDTLTPETIQFHEPSRFPSMDYDLTVQIGDDSVYAIVREILEAWRIPELTGFRVVDIYRGGQGVNVTLRLNFSSPERTLVREDVQASVDRLIGEWKQKGVNLSGSDA